MEVGLNSLDKKPQIPVLTRTLPQGQTGTNFTPVPIGVVDAPQMPKTPIKDRLDRAKEENVRVVLNVEKKPPGAPVRLMTAINAVLIGAAAVLSVKEITKLVKWLSKKSP